jgi:HTH-type transcriptional regulator/antitoxin HigA
MEIKPIRNEDDYKNTLKEIEQLWDFPVGSPEGDRMEVLVTLVEAYESEHYPIPVINDPVGVLEYYMESKGLSRSDLIPYIGQKERVSDIFRHKRQLSLEMIRRLHEGLNIPAELLIGKSRSYHSEKNIYIGSSNRQKLTTKDQTQIKKVTRSM